MAPWFRVIVLFFLFSIYIKKSLHKLIKNIIFDLGGVVIPLTPEVAWDRFEALGIKDTRQRMGLYGQTGIFLEVENGTIDALTFQKKLARLAQQQQPDLFKDQPDPSFSFEQTLWAWKGYVEGVDISRLNNLLKLKQDYNVILLSNTNPFIVAWAESDDFSGDGHPLNYYFHQTFYSCQMKDYKPSKTIFQKLIDQTGINPSESLFLDDGQKNIEAAESLGIHGLLVEKNQDWMPFLTKELVKLNNSH